MSSEELVRRKGSRRVGGGAWGAALLSNHYHFSRFLPSDKVVICIDEKKNLWQENIPYISSDLDDGDPELELMHWSRIMKEGRYVAFFFEVK